MSLPKRILILTLSVGSGHVSAAQVIRHALLDGGDNVDVQVLDALELARRWFSWVYVYPYWWMLRHAPWMWRRLFERRQRKRHRATAPAWVFRRGCEAVLQRLKSFAPHQVIVTEIGAAEIASLAKREGWFDGPILVVQTDYQIEPPWVHREIDMYCVGCEEARMQLIGWGVSPNRILVCGIPVDPSFAWPFEVPELTQALGLDAKRPVVLLMGGGMGPVPLDAIVESLQLCGPPLQVIAVAGHDQRMQARLEGLRGKLALDLRVLGWTDNIPELMAVADLLITKPGGVTSAEALAAGLPMLLTHPIPGPEERHLCYLEREGVALSAPRLEDIPTLTMQLLTHPERLEEMASRARELARPGAAHAAAQVSRALLDKGASMDLLAPLSAKSGESAYLM
jgi:processive 1,2-diacylglycerol beta-glucosyltransferase